MSTVYNIHQVFARFFKDEHLEPYLFELSRMLEEGHICMDPQSVDLDGLKEAGYDDLPGVETIASSPLVSDGREHTPFILLGDRLYMQRYYYYESLILDRIRGFIDAEGGKLQQRLTDLLRLQPEIAALFPGSELTNGKVDWQWMAAVTTVLHDFSIITGGPGTGKTTTVAKVLSLLLQLNHKLRIALCAPTGKAAARMAESLRAAGKNSAPFIREAFEGLQPATIHRLLGTIHSSPEFKHNRLQPLDVDVVIVDEASMIDVALMAKLMDAVGEETKLILLGDKDQLASVEAGSLFGDLCKALPTLNGFSERFLQEIAPLLPAGSVLPEASDGTDSPHLLFEHIVELQFSHRFSDGKGIGKFSKAILNNQPELIQEFFGNQDDQVKIDTKYDTAVFDHFVRGYKEFIEQPDILSALQKLNNLRVLCAVREGAFGVDQVNARIERLLRQKAGLKPFEPFYQNRPIMVTSNNSQLNLYNGDIGIIREDEQGVMRAWFEAADGSLKSVLPGFVGKVETAFAMTIHKSQGSEFKDVLIMLPQNEQATKMMTRELLYTAVTRARSQVIIQGSEAAIITAAAVGIHRGSGVIGRLRANP